MIRQRQKINNQTLYKMDGQDWIPVTVRRRNSKKDHKNGLGNIIARDPEKSEKIRMAKLADAEGPITIKRINAESLQSLIRKRIELNLTQEKTDILCAFPRNTIKDIESNRLVPNEDQRRKIQRHLGIQLKIGA